MNTEEAINKFIAYAKRYDSSAPNKSWYVGITSKDPNIRKKRHEYEKGITCKHFKSLIICQDKDTALELEQILKDEGFSKTEAELEPIMEAKSMRGVSFSTKKEKAKKHEVYIYLAVKKR
jgi:predicted GIY-YIG superfamily endonuclease